MDRPIKKVIYGIFAAVMLLGMCLFVAALSISDIPVWERSSAWRWFLVGWVSSAIAVLLWFLPYWIKGTLAKPLPGLEGREEEMRSSIKAAPWAGMALGGVGASAGLVASPSTTVGAMSLGAGLFSAVFVTMIALHTTKKGRAMLDEAKRSNHAA